MNVARTIAEMRQLVRRARQAGKTSGLVPTMGALHEGHMSLIDAARGDCGFVVVSIFVNPAQFGPGEDFSRYPRAPEDDLAACRKRSADAVFMPSAEEMYPSPAPATRVVVKGLDERLCGRSRPGHFAGVCAVVAKLFNIVQPDKAYFGAKDFQQATIIRRMTTDLDFPVKVVVCPTVRERDGLAMSSRNAYLTPAERRQAPALYAALRTAAEMIRASRPPAEEVKAAVRACLADRAPDGAIDYVEVVDPNELTDASNTNVPVLVALAVKFGQARLIDNIIVDGPGGAT